MEAIYRRLLELVDQGAGVALATVVRTKGSVPREPGARMLIYPGGQHLGTVGGGCGEGEVLRQAVVVIATGQARLVEVDLTDDISMQSQGICGGSMGILVAPWNQQQRSLLAALASAEAAGQAAALVMIVAASQPGRVGGAVVLTGDATIGELGVGASEAPILASARQAMAEGRSQLLAAGSTEVFVHVSEVPPLLLIVGAGHIAVPLAQTAAVCGFRVAVLDDRPSFANRDRFPQAQTVIVGGYEEELARFPIDSRTYIVLVTRGHQNDVPSLLAVLDSPAAYLGMIGSKRRVAGVFQLLQAEHGISGDRLARVHSPIGLSIGAETPAEIAVSIMAQVIQVRRRPQSPAPPLPE